MNPMDLAPRPLVVGRFVTFLAVLAVAQPLQAQAGGEKGDWRFGITGGSTITSLSGDYVESTESRAGWTIDYQVQKAPKELWNLILGTQMDLSRRWQMRTELGLGDRTSLLVGVNYRFAFKGG